jgi:hypothetical protein
MVEMGVHSPEGMPMTPPAELSQGVITPSEEPGRPGPVGPGWDRWDRLAALLGLAGDLEVIKVPEAIEERYLDALGDRKHGRPAPSLAPIKRELVRLREEVAWTLRTMGYAQGRIAGMLGVSQPAVCKILRRVERRVLARMEADVRAVKDKQAAQLEYLYDQALRAWKASQGSLEERTGTTTDLVRQEKCVRRTMSRKGPGDPRFLAVAISALESERRLCGLGATSPPPGSTVQVNVLAVLKAMAALAPRLTPALEAALGGGRAVPFEGTMGEPAPVRQADS